ncbi:MAG TPA: cytochrome P450 [Pseudonocardia sp.]
MARRSDSDIDTSRFSHFDQSYAADPGGMWDALRRSEQVPWSDQHGGFHVLARYEQICAAARDPELFCSGQGNTIPPFPFPPLIPVNVDPPLLHQYRRLLTPYLTPAKVAERRVEFAEIADSLFKSFLEKAGTGATVDFIEEFAVPFPQQVALRAIGFPEKDRETTARAVFDLSHLRGINESVADSAAAQVIGRITELIEERRSAPKRTDLIGVLLDAEIDGRPLGDQELVFYIFLLLTGGLDTTTAATAGMFMYLGQHPGERERLRGDPALRRTATDEFVRWTSPVQGLARTLTRDTEFHGCPMTSGGKVMLLWAAGNRDADAFPDPDDVQLDRSPNHHLGFGMGPHRCLGSHLAKLMLDIAIERGLSWLGDFHVVDPDSLQWVGGETFGLKALPLRLGAAPGSPSIGGR